MFRSNYGRFNRKTIAISTKVKLLNACVHTVESRSFTTKMNVGLMSALGTSVRGRDTTAKRF